jgi:hypothetical protein
MHRDGNPGRRGYLGKRLYPGCRRQEGLYLRFTGSERLAPEVRLVGRRLCLYRKGKSKRARLGGLSAFWWKL